MAESPSGPVSASPVRGGGRGKSRGGLGKYLRAQGRGRRGGGRQAVFNERLLLEGDAAEEVDPESEEAKELRVRYSKRQLTSNADRYVEPEPELGSDGASEWSLLSPYFLLYDIFLIVSIGRGRGILQVKKFLSQRSTSRPSWNANVPRLIYLPHLHPNPWMMMTLIIRWLMLHPRVCRYRPTRAGKVVYSKSNGIIV
jgi:hypothetical protein